MLEEAKALKNGGLAVPLSGVNGLGLVAAILRWQNDQGKRVRHEFSVALVDADGATELNPETVSELLKAPAMPSNAPHQRKIAEKLHHSAVEAFDVRLDEASNLGIHSENRQLISAGWC